MYEVSVWTNDETPGGQWLDATVYRGPSFRVALTTFLREKRHPRGAYVTLRWG